MTSTIAPSPSFYQRLQEFLSTTRVGIDFGERAGGIAVVRDNEVLQAETFLDFHEATLEQRRTLRRRRRSRHAKKMRLARLRSWVLRQKLPNGERLPDPYSLMRDPAYMVQPGVYRKKGTDPKTSTSWIELAKRGKTDAAEFVRAVTLIFQKRGYKWDAIDLDEMPASKLKEFLLSARIPANDPTLRDQVRARIECLKSEPGSDEQTQKRKTSPDELEGCLQLACERGMQPARPRVAEHRSVKEADVRDVIEGFARSAGISDNQAARWKKELAGKRGLLNKVLRPARFDNRLKTGCSWCGKATPRKAKFRELAYRAAVNNLRVRDHSGSRPLRNDEKEPFFELWNMREDVPGAHAISERLSKKNCQKEMARQLHDLLTQENPPGRTSLCVDHLRMAANGKSMKDAGIAWQRIALRKAPNPCAERRDARVLHRLEQILFRSGLTGDAAWRFGPVAFINLEIPEPRTDRPAQSTQKERKLEGLKERLVAETNGCIYKVLGGCGGEMGKDHIYPRSRGGPDVQTNLVASCVFHNREKGIRTPFEWLTANNGPWRTFLQYLKGLRIHERKKRILMNETAEYPEGDPSPLARIGARPRQFFVAITKLFNKYRVSAPRLDYRVGQPLVQRIKGSETKFFRLSWFVKPDGAENFPFPRNRSSLFNHAEDAAIVACIPPYTWREQVFCHTAERQSSNGYMKPMPGLATPELAPDWAAYTTNRRSPLVHILGRYRVTWRTKFTNTTFSRDPETVHAPWFCEFKPIKNLERKHLKNIVSPAIRTQIEHIAASLGLMERGNIEEVVARQLARKAAKRSDIQKQLPRAAETIVAEYPIVRRTQVLRTKAGPFAKIVPSDGPARKVEITTPSEGVFIWRERKQNKLTTQISLVRPRPLQRFGIPRVDPAIPAGATVLGELRRHQMIWLKGAPDRPQGFYRVAQCRRKGVTIEMEEAVPAEILGRPGIMLDKIDPDQIPANRSGRVNFTLGKQALVEYFENNKKQNGRAG
ncbi:MAG TPA: RRXRR domain-containing protein [Candidatus Acidoferrales bacterium]|nr:RRXRR domain-containing protein [Candidatus Acidoferrales bacterium]